MDKKFFISLLLSLATVWSLQYFWGNRNTEQVSQEGAVHVAQVADTGQPVKVVVQQTEVMRPLSMEPVFEATKFNGAHTEDLIEVRTDLCHAVFSTHGGQLASLDFTKHTGKQGTPLRTVYKKSSFDQAQRAQGCFLLAFQADAPFIYQLERSVQTEQGQEVVFTTRHAGWAISKRFVLHQKSYQIDCYVSFVPVVKDALPLLPRLYVAAPFVPEVHEDAVRVCAWNAGGKRIDTTDIAKADGLAWFWRDEKPVFGVENKFFVHSLIGDADHFAARAYVRIPTTGTPSFILEGHEVQFETAYKVSFYMGPKVYDQLSAVDPRLEQLLAFGWLSPVCKWLLALLEWLYRQLGNFGLAIIALAIVLKLPFMPLSMYARKRMEVYQRYQPTLNRIRQKYQHDLTMQHQETMKFLKEHNLSPATQMIGCLPLLMQAPILFSLYRMLSNYLDLYQAPFFGWLYDLSASDPYYILPILMGASMLLQQLLTPAQADEKQRLVMVVMTLVFTAFFARFPAGLVLYWLTNNLLTIGEDLGRKYIIRW